MNDSERTVSVLLIDDESLNRMTFKRVFRRKYDITVACSAELGLKLMEHASFDVVFVDYSMDGMNGLEFANIVRHHKPELLLVMITGFSDSEDIQAAHLDGTLDGVLNKPWRRADIESWVAKALERPVA